MSNDLRRSWKAAFVMGAFALLVNPAWAEIVSTEQAFTPSDRERVRAFLQREDVESQFKALGLAPELAKQRVDALTDPEIRAIAGKLDTLPAGGALSNNELIIIILLVILLLIVL